MQQGVGAWAKGHSSSQRISMTRRGWGTLQNMAAGDCLMIVGHGDESAIGTTEEQVSLTPQALFDKLKDNLPEGTTLTIDIAACGTESFAATLQNLFDGDADHKYKGHVTVRGKAGSFKFTEGYEPEGAASGGGGGGGGGGK